MSTLDAKRPRHIYINSEAYPSASSSTFSSSVAGILQQNVFKYELLLLEDSPPIPQEIISWRPEP